MFSVEQKRKIAFEIEKLLLSLNHPEMPEKNPNFKLTVEGKEGWSFAEISPNWVFDKANPPGVNPHNEQVADEMESK